MGEITRVVVVVVTTGPTRSRGVLNLDNSVLDYEVLFARYSISPHSFGGSSYCRCCACTRPESIPHRSYCRLDFALGYFHISRVISTTANTRNSSTVCILVPCLQVGGNTMRGLHGSSQELAKCDPDAPLCPKNDGCIDAHPTHERDIGSLG